MAIQGVGFDRAGILKAEIGHADGFAVTRSSDNANIVAARIAHSVFRVPYVVARVNDPRCAEIYRRLGLVTISPTIWGAPMPCALRTHADMAPVAAFGNDEVIIVNIEASPHLIGGTVNSFNVPGEINVVAVTRKDHALLPTPGTEIRDGDVIQLAVLASAMECLEALLGLSIRE